MTGQTAPLTIESLRPIAKEVWAALHLVGENTAYIYSEDKRPRVRKGYSYWIPKEEQVRSELHRLLSSRNRGCELEWNLYSTTKPSSKPEIDLAVWANGKPLAFIEVKRAWSLPGWLNKRAEHRAGIMNDVKKLQQLRVQLRNLKIRVPQVFGVFVVLFLDELDKSIPDTRTRAAHKILADIEGTAPEFLYQDAENPICTYEESKGVYRNVFARMEFLALT